MFPSSITRFIPKTSFTSVLLRAPFLEREVGSLPQVAALDVVSREGGAPLQTRVTQRQEPRLSVFLRAPYLPREVGAVDLPMAYRSMFLENIAFGDALQACAQLQRISFQPLLTLSEKEMISMTREDLMEHVEKIAINMENLTLLVASLSLEPGKAGLLVEKIVPEEGIVLSESSAKGLISQMTGMEALVLLRLLVEGQEGVAQVEVPNLDEALTETEVKNILYRLITDGGLALSKNSFLLLLQASVQESISDEKPMSIAALTLIADGIVGSFTEKSPFLLPSAEPRVLPAKKKTKPAPVEQRQVPTTVSMAQMYKTSQIRDEAVRKQEFLEIAGPLLQDHGHATETMMSLELFLKECGFTQKTLETIYQEPSMIKMQVFINRLRFDPAFKTSSSFAPNAGERYAYVDGKFATWLHR